MGSITVVIYVGSRNHASTEMMVYVRNAGFTPGIASEANKSETPRALGGRRTDNTHGLECILCYATAGEAEDGVECKRSSVKIRKVGSSGRKRVHERAFLVASIHVSSVTRVMSVGNTRFLESNGALLSLHSLTLSLPSSSCRETVPLSPYLSRSFPPSAGRTSPRYLLWPVRAYVHGK